MSLSIEPDPHVAWKLTLVLGDDRFPGNLELDHEDYAINGGTLDAVYTTDCWLEQLAQLSAGHGPVVLLPFNFSDQCTGWLRVTQPADGPAEVQAGWSGVDQYSLEPADLRSPQTRIRDFEPTPDGRIELPLADLIADVTVARDVVARWARSAEARSAAAINAVRAPLSGPPTPSEKGGPEGPPFPGELR